MNSLARCKVGYFLLLLLLLCSFTFASQLLDPFLPLKAAGLRLHNSVGYRSDNATALNSTLAEALKLVQEATTQQGVYNSHRVANPKRNTEVSKDSDAAIMTRKRAASDGPRAPTLTPALRKAAALIAEFQAKQQANTSSHRENPQPKYLHADQAPIQARAAKGKYWLELIKHNGHAPMGANDSWPVFRDVTDPKFAGGAKGDGIHDDTEAINAAIAYGGNCGQGCLSSSVKGTLVYFPAGTYLISSPINAMYYSQLVGDATHRPTIKTSRNFIGLGAIQSDVYIPGNGGDEWYVEQSNFYRQVRNFVIDIRDTVTEKAAAFHWQVAQATSMTNVYVYASTDPQTTQMGLFTENGSGGFMADVFIDGGKCGIFGGNQQYTVRNFEISRQTDSNICLIWDWGWTWSNLFLMDAPNAFNLLNPDANGADATPTGSIYVMDSTFARVKNVIKTASSKHSIDGTTIITFDNVSIQPSVTSLVHYEKDGLSFDVPREFIDHFVIGNVEGTGESFFQGEIHTNEPRPSLLNEFGSKLKRKPYFYKSRPQYEDLTLDDIINVKDHGAKGDGSTDDTAAVKAVLAMASSSKLIYFPAGAYVISSTITIPSHALITGEVWSQLVASGSFFQDIKNPKPMVKVGNTGEKGTVEISDILFTSIGALPGLILTEWNVAAEKQGSVGMFDSHFRIGGTYGSKLTLADCPKVTAISSRCVAASMLLHITPQSNGYFENLWAWVADHDIDDPKNTMVTIASARGILVESANGPTWLFGTSSEHNMLYQYNFYNTSNFFAGMIQTESPYFQHTRDTASPGPFEMSIGVFNNDPDFFGFDCIGPELSCRMSWAVMVKGVTGGTIAGAGLYSWFDAYDQSVCVDAQNCQEQIFNDQGGNQLFSLFNLVTIGAASMVDKTDTREYVNATKYTQAHAHPFWSALAVYEGSSNANVMLCDESDTSPACLPSDPCDLTKTFADIHDLQSQAGKFSSSCLPYYTLDVLSDSLDTNLAAYDDVNNGYDAVFGDYTDYVHDMIGDFMSKYMLMSNSKNETGGPGNKFFDCTLNDYPNPTTVQCPVSWLSLMGQSYYEITYTLKDEEGLYKDLTKNFGINKTWIEFGDDNQKDTRCPNTGGGIAGSPHENFVVPTEDNKRDLQKRCGPTGFIRHNLPMGKKKFDVPNPKDVVAAAMPRLRELQSTIVGKQIDAVTGTMVNNSLWDINQVMSLPVFMLSQSVISMEAAKKKGEAEAKKKKWKLVEEILSAVLMFIPFLDELTPELLLVDGLLDAVAFLGNAALALKDISENPINAPIDILGLLTGSGKGKGKGGKGGGKGDGDVDYQALSAKRDAIDKSTLKKMGAEIKELDDSLQDILKKQCPI